MADEVELLAVYLHLARASELRRRPHVRDRLLVLAAAQAMQIPLPRIAAYCRRRVLGHNPRHLLGHWAGLPQALAAPEFRSVLRSLQRRYPPEKAEALLDSLRIERGCERATYYSDEEYAAGILGTTLAKLTELFGEEGSSPPETGPARY